MAFPIYSNAVSYATPNAASVTPALPASRFNGQLLKAYVYINATGKTISLSGTGWTSGGTDNTGNISVAWAWCIVSGTETAPTFSWTGSTNCATQVFLFTGNDPVSPIGNSSISHGNSSTAVDLAGFAATQPGSLYWANYHVDTNQVLPGLTDFTNLGQANGAQGSTDNSLANLYGTGTLIDGKATITAANWAGIMVEVISGLTKYIDPDVRTAGAGTGTTIFSLDQKIENGATVTKLGAYSPTPQTLNLKIANRTVAGTYNVVIDQSYSHGGTGWEDVTLGSPYVVPNTGDYFVGLYNPTTTSYYNGSINPQSPASRGFKSGNIGIGSSSGYSESGTGAFLLRYTVSSLVASAGEPTILTSQLVQQALHFDDSVTTLRTSQVAQEALVKTYIPGAPTNIRVTQVVQQTLRSQGAFVGYKHSFGKITG